MKILVMGLPGAGKTTLAKALVARLGAVHFNADEMRANVNRDLGFSLSDRLEQARRMGWLCDKVALAGTPVVADFVCPTPEARVLFGEAFTVWLDRIATSRFADTNQLFTAPDRYDVRVGEEGSPQHWVERICEQLASRHRASDAASFVIDGSSDFCEASFHRVMHCIARCGRARIIVVGHLDREIEARIEARLSGCRDQVDIIYAAAIEDLRATAD